MDAYKRNTLAAYNANGTLLAKKYADLQVHRLDDIERFLQSVPGKILLDLGAGPGIDGYLMHQRGFSVTCGDLSETMLSLCEQKGLPTIRVDLESLELPAEAYDGIYAAACFLHIPKTKLPAAIEHVKYSLRDDGTFFISVKEGEGERIDTSSGERFFAYWKQDELNELLKRNFDIIHTCRQQVEGQEAWIKTLCRRKL